VSPADQASSFKAGASITPVRAGRQTVEAADLFFGRVRGETQGVARLDPATAHGVEPEILVTRPENTAGCADMELREERLKESGSSLPPFLKHFATNLNPARARPGQAAAGVRA